MRNLCPTCDRPIHQVESCNCSTPTTPGPPSADAMFDEIMRDPSKPMYGHHAIPYWVFLKTLLIAYQDCEMEYDSGWGVKGKWLDARIAAIKEKLDG